VTSAGPHCDPYCDPYCDHCGERSDVGSHERCIRMRALEPPRYCPRCRRRMVVQVVPRGWVARCAEHGEIENEPKG
jgi:hypothetical protein